MDAANAGRVVVSLVASTAAVAFMQRALVCGLGCARGVVGKSGTALNGIPAGRLKGVLRSCGCFVCLWLLVVWFLVAVMRGFFLYLPVFWGVSGSSISVGV